MCDTIEANTPTLYLGIVLWYVARVCALSGQRYNVLPFVASKQHFQVYDGIMPMGNQRHAGVSGINATSTRPRKGERSLTIRPDA